MELQLKNQLHDFVITIGSDFIALVDNKTNVSKAITADVSIQGHDIRINGRKYKAWCNFDKLKIKLLFSS